MKKFLALVLCLMILPAAQGGEIALQVENPWIFSPPPVSKETAAFMTLINTGATPLRVTGAETPAAGRVVPMITTKTEGRTGMKDVPFFEIPAGGKLVLKPGGDHLMIYDLKGTLTDGGKVSFTLLVEPGGKLEIEIPASRSAPK